MKLIYFPLKKILRIVTTFFKVFLKDYFAFFNWTAGKKDGKEEGKAGKVEQRVFFLKEVVKKSKDAEKKRNEINKEVGYKKQVFNRYIWFFKENLNRKNKFFDKIKTRDQSSNLSKFFLERFFGNVCNWFYRIQDRIQKSEKFQRFYKEKFTENFLNKFYTNLKIVPLFLHFLYLMKTSFC